MKALLALLCLAFSFSSMSDEIFVVKKSKRVKNVLHFQANVVGCKIKSITNNWIMGEEDGHSEPINKSEKSYFTPVVSYNNGSEARFTLGALDKMASKIRSSEVVVRLSKCKAEAFMELDGQEVELNEIFVNVNMMMMPQDVTIKGDLPDGQHIAHKIKN